MSDPISILNEALSGRYRIESELGEGGMATVYLARDLRHERRVALKVLKEELAAVVGADRFLAEIRTTANLQHPQILPLFDSGRAGSQLFYVMPYVSGESLRSRLDREKQLPVADAVRIAAEVAEGLDYAHREGVIHRDVKPGNILLQDGKAVISDFGIALAIAKGDGGRLTGTGISLGTPYYMSPEQATGDHTVGAATDIYALGCVLHEMLVGEPPFTGSTPQAVLGKVLSGSVEPASATRGTVPPHIDGVIARAVEKVPADRFRSARHFADALADPGPGHPTRSVPKALERETNVRGRAAVALPWMLAAALAVALVITRSGADAPHGGDPLRLPLAPNFEGQLGSNGGVNVGVSPDGRWLAVVGITEEADRLYLRARDAPELIPIPGSDNGRHPHFSSDGSWLAFSSRGEIYRVAVAGGGSPERLAAGSIPAWSTDDQIVYRATDGVRSLNPVTLETTLLLPDSVVGFAQRPTLLPDGRTLLFYSSPGGEHVVSTYRVDTGERRVLGPGSWPHYVPTGHIVFGTQDQTAMAVPYDLESGEVVWEPRPVLPSVKVNAGGAMQLAFSNSGLLIYAEAKVAAGPRRARPSPLNWVRLDGEEEQLVVSAVDARSPSLSDDGRLVAFESGRQIVVHEIATGQDRPLTFDGENTLPFLSPDGRWVYFSSIRDGSRGVDGYRVSTAGASAVEQIWSREGDQWPVALSPNGRWLVVIEEVEDTARLLLADLDATEIEFTEYARTAGRIGQASVSPDGGWLAYRTEREDGREVWVQSFPQPTGPVQVSLRGGISPVWHPDGGSLYYIGDDRDLIGDARLMRADVEFDPSFVVTDRIRERMWPHGSGGRRAGYAMHPLGDRLLTETGGTFFGDIYVVANWFEELTRLVGN